MGCLIFFMTQKEHGELGMFSDMKTCIVKIVKNQ